MKFVSDIKNIFAIILYKLLIIHCETYEESCKGCIFNNPHKCTCKIDVPVEWGKNIEVQE